ncbi:phosphotransferase enzyme family protein [Colletotrichum karsti]|uniref:Phosphotransferase enzyme family protein n=1 Tax=Colletotrichum karsti TaxID=1095194 RepID=A0A9P6LN50_9PEZI|nr:phosphotransferase enzyme family protein [Colletotrichum karsti]KAF9878851.1 phosphotransferase enzyme family protein [Colletotrichum karsti]
MSLTPLTGGQTNFTYLARLKQEIQEEDGNRVMEVMVKHGEPYMARHPQNSITVERCNVEAACLKELEAMSLRLSSQEISSITVRSPTCYIYDEEMKTQIQEYLPDVVHLKKHLLEFPSSGTSVDMRPQYEEVGCALAEYICQFHQLTSNILESKESQNTTSSSSSLKEALYKDNQMQKLKHMINYDWLLERVSQFPSILGHLRDTFEEVKKQALEEIRGGDKTLTVIHGDFCPQNVLIGDKPLAADLDTTLFVVDWENAQLGVPIMDHGEMLGELYAIWLCQRKEASLWIAEGYCRGLGNLSESLAFRIALQLGVHLISFGAISREMESSEQTREVARIGGEIIVNAWGKQKAWFEQSELSVLFAAVSED